MPSSHLRHGQDKTVLPCHVSVVWTELTTSQDCRRQKITKLNTLKFFVTLRKMSCYALWQYAGYRSNERVKLGVTVHRWLHGSAPQYLVDYCKSTTAMLPVASGPGLQVAISSSCHDTVAPSSAVGRFLLPETHCQTISVIRRWAKTLLGDH